MDVTLRNELTRPYKIPRKKSSVNKNDGQESSSETPMMNRGSSMKTPTDTSSYRSPVLTTSQRAQPQPSTSAFKPNVANNMGPLTTTTRNSLKRTNNPSG